MESVYPFSSYILLILFLLQLVQQSNNQPMLFRRPELLDNKEMSINFQGEKLKDYYMHGPDKVNLCTFYNQRNNIGEPKIWNNIGAISSCIAIFDFSLFLPFALSLKISYHHFASILSINSFGFCKRFFWAILLKFKF